MRLLFHYQLLTGSSYPSLIGKIGESPLRLFYPTPHTMVGHHARVFLWSFRHACLFASWPRPHFLDIGISTNAILETEDWELVPGTGFEPARIASTDFKSVVSACSTIPA